MSQGFLSFSEKHLLCCKKVCVLWYHTLIRMLQFIGLGTLLGGLTSSLATMHTCFRKPSLTHKYIIKIQLDNGVIVQELRLCDL